MSPASSPSLPFFLPSSLSSSLQEPLASDHCPCAFDGINRRLKVRLRCPLPLRCELHSRSTVHTKRLNRFGHLGGKKKGWGPEKEPLASFLPGSHRLSCSWLNFGSQDTFSQFPLLMSLDLFCGVTGNAACGEAAQTVPLPGMSPSVPGWCCCSPQAATVWGLYIWIPRRGFSLSQSEESYPLNSLVSTVTCHPRAWPPVAPGLGQRRTEQGLANRSESG